YLFPVYEKILNELKIDIKIIVPYRNPAEVAGSLHLRDNMSLEKGMLLWAYNFLLAEKFTRDYERIFVNFDELLTNTPEVINKISSQLSIPLDEKYRQNQKQIDEFLEPGLKHHNISVKNLSDSTPDIIKNILLLNDQFNYGMNTDLKTKFDSLRDELFSYKKLFYNESIVNSLARGETARQNLKLKEQEIRQAEQRIQTKNKKIIDLENQILKKNQNLEKLKNELTEIYSSKTWKLTRPFIKLIQKLKNL
ncbi:MAG: hypothetical protein ACQESP_13305, partial [Candidatus Muiribacteriota bacterium]